jgi:hypothetical protein
MFNKIPGGNNSKDHLLTMEEAEELLKPYQENLNVCIQHGWDSYMKDYAHKHHILGARARAAIVFDEIVAKAEIVFDGMPDVKFVKKNASFLLYIGDKITLRFKKIKKCGRCSNIETRQQVLFRAQAQMHLPTMLEGTLVQAGYVLDDLQREIDRKMVVCQLNNRVLWQFKLTGESGAVVELNPSTAPTETPKTTFEPKPEKQKEIEQEKRKKKTSESGE